MKTWIQFVLKSTQRFNVFDYGMLKLCLISLGIIIGVYLAHTFEDFLWVFWMLFLLSWLYIVVRVFTNQAK